MFPSPSPAPDPRPFPRATSGPRSGADPGPGRAAGFTLLELMVAIGILVFGVTTLLGVLSVGVGTRRAAEQQSRAVLLAEQVLHRLESDVLASAPLPEPDPDSGQMPDLGIAPVTVDRVDGFPGMKYTVTFQVDADHPELVLARINVTWLEQGESVGQEFLRLLAREIPYSQRVAKRRGRQP